MVRIKFGPYGTATQTGMVAESKLYRNKLVLSLNALTYDKERYRQYLLRHSFVPCLVEPDGFEPSTLCLQSRRSPAELWPH